ncbi:hypothetical protein HNP38_002034 [Chryseobacterium defluvii]|uniref:Uncharacterized protein n=1 Tax=Chryseobacterium defluvii TaxID=160396 RepID=A0A840KFD8_9FLAO|nr:hypothetical protein [Chryseobacterium defluvii]MBB4806738.1 hypothetical protein [Chryseobacterium defluvii]
MTNFKIISELIDYNNSEIPINFLTKSFEALGEEKLTILVKDILFWQKIVYTSPTMANKGKVTNKNFYLLEDNMVINDYNVFFETCPELTNFFVLKDNKIILSPDLSIKEINKMQEIIDKGYKLSLKINIGKSKTE